MFAPPGVDSDDSSGEEDLFPAPRPAPAPRPGFFKTVFSLKSPPKKQGNKKKVPLEAAGKLAARPPMPPKKKVRIRLEGEEHPDGPTLDLLQSPISPIEASHSSPLSITSTAGGHISPFPPPTPVEGGKVGEEILGLLQQILIETAKTYSQETNGPQATLIPLDDAGETSTPADNTPTLSSTHPSPAVLDAAQEANVGSGKKPGKLSLLGKLAEMASPPRPSSSSDNSPTSPEGSAAPPYADPTTGAGPSQSNGHTPQGSPIRPHPLSHLQSAQIAPLSAVPQGGYQSNDCGVVASQTPTTWPAQPQPPSPQQPLWQVSGFGSAPFHHPPYSAPPHQQSPHPSSFVSPLYTGLAAQYYLGGPVSPPAEYPFQTAPVPPLSAPPQSPPFQTVPTQQPSSPGGWGFNFSNVPANQFTNWPSHWRPGEAHWQGPSDPVEPSQIGHQDRGVGTPTSQEHQPPVSQPMQMPHPITNAYPIYAPQSTVSPWPTYPTSQAYSQQRPPPQLQAVYPPYTRAPWYAGQPASVPQSHDTAPSNTASVSGGPATAVGQTGTIHQQPTKSTASGRGNLLVDEVPRAPSPQPESAKTYEPLQSPRILKSSDEGFTEVLPYPEARQTSTSPSSPISPPIEPAVPKKLSKEELEKRQSEHERVMRDRAERKEREPAAEWALSPDDVNKAVEMARKARDESTGGKKALGVSGDGDDGTVMMKKQIDMLKRQREKINGRAEAGQVGKDEAKAKLAKIEMSIKELQKSVVAGLLRPTTANFVMRPDVLWEDAETSATKRHSKGDSQSEVLKERRSEKGKAKAPPPPDPPTSAESLNPQEALESRLQDLQERKDRIKQKAAKGEMGKDEAKAELLRIGMKIRETEKSLERMWRENTGVVPGPSSRPAFAAPVLAADKAREEAGNDREAKGGLAEVQMKMDKIKRKMKEGKIDTKEAEKGLSRLQKEREALTKRSASQPIPATTSASGEIEQAQDVPMSAELPSSMAVERREVMARIERIQRKVKDGSMDPEKGKAEISRLKAELASLEGSEGSSKEPLQRRKERLPGEVEAVHEGVPKRRDTSDGALLTERDPDKKAEASNADSQLAEVDKQIDRTQRKVKDGSMDKQTASKQLKKLTHARATLEAKVISTSSTSAVAPIERNAGVDDGVTSGGGPQDQKAELMKRMERVERKAKEGAIDKETAKKDLAKLQAALDQLSARAEPKDSASPAEMDKKDGEASTALEAEAGKSTSQLKRERILQKMQNIKSAVKAGKLDKDTAKRELGKLEAALTSLDKAAGPSAGYGKALTEAGPPQSRNLFALQANVTDQPSPPTDDEKREEIKPRMERIKRKVKEGFIDKEKAKSEMKMLEAALQALVQSRSPAQTGKGDVVRAEDGKQPKSPETPAENGCTDEQGEVDSRLQKNKEQIQQVQAKIAATNDESKTEAYQWMAKKLQEERTRLKKRQAELSKAPKEKTSSDKVTVPSRAATVEEVLDEEAELDPEILAIVLAEEQAAKLSTESKIPDAALPKIPVPASIERTEATRAEAKTGDQQNLSPAPGPGQKALNRTVSDDQSEPVATRERGTADTPRESCLVNHGVPENWSKALVSIANCIDFANDLLARIVERHTSSPGSDWASTKHTLVVQVLPRFLTSLLIHRDLVRVMNRMLGDDSSRSIDELMVHVNRVQSYLTRALQSRSAEQGLNQLLSAIDHVLHFSSFVNPHLISSLRSLLKAWRKDGPNTTNILHTVKFVQDIMAHPDPQDWNSPDTTKPMGLLDRLIGLLADPHEPATADRGTSKMYRLSLHANEPNVSLAPHTVTGKAPDPAYREHPPADCGHEDHSSGVPHIEKADQASHWVRTRLASMVGTLRHRPKDKIPLGQPAENEAAEYQDPTRSPTIRSRGVESISPEISSTDYPKQGQRTPNESRKRQAEEIIPSEPGLEHSLKTPRSAGAPPPLHLAKQTVDFLSTPHPPMRAPSSDLPQSIPSMTRQQSTPPYPARDRRRPEPTSTPCAAKDPVYREDSPLRALAHYLRKDEEHDAAQLTTVVRPPGPDFDAPRSEHLVHAPEQLSRRASGWSSDSHYSDDASYESDGTVASDIVAGDLLAQADSSPPWHANDDAMTLTGAETVDEDQVERAKEVLFVK